MVGEATALRRNETSCASALESGDRGAGDRAFGVLELAGVSVVFFFNGALEGVFDGVLLADGGRSADWGEDFEMVGVCRASFFKGDRSSLVFTTFSFAPGEGLTAGGFGCGDGDGEGRTGVPLFFATTVRLGSGLTGRGGALSSPGGDNETVGTFVGSLRVEDEACVALPESSLVRRFRVPRRTGDGGILDGAAAIVDPVVVFGLYLGSADG